MKHHHPLSRILMALPAFAAVSLTAQWQLVDDFESGSLTNWGHWYNEATAHPDHPPTTSIVDDPITSTGSKVLSIYPGMLLENVANQFTWLPIPLIKDNFPNANLSTLYFQIARPLVEIDGQMVPGQVDITFGLIQLEPAPGETPPINPAYALYRTLGRINTGGGIDIFDNSTSPTYNPLNGAQPTTSDTWYHIWFVMDHSDNIFSVYIEGGSEWPQQTLVYSDSVYRGGTGQFDDLIMFMLGTSTGSQTAGLAGRDPTYFDNIYVDVNSANLTYPAGAPTVNHWGPYVVNANGNVDTGSWAGTLHAAHAPWIYSFSLAQWLYLPEPPESASDGAWTYVLNPGQ